MAGETACPTTKINDFPTLGGQAFSLPDALMDVLPAPPDPFVERPSLEVALRAALLESPGGSSISNIALCGQGGFGKTALAARLCQDADLIDAFSGGIFWFSMSSPPNLHDQFNRALAALTGDATPAATEQEARNRLTERLSERNILVVADDLWHADDIERLPPGNPRTLLITTRDLNVAKEARARSVEIGAMTLEESQSLLTAGLPGYSNQSAEIGRIAERLHFCPLAISLARGKLARSRNSPADSLAAISKAIDLHHVTAFDSHDPSSRESVCRRLRETLEHLKAEDRRALLDWARNPKIALPPDRERRLMRRFLDLGLLQPSPEARAAVHPLIAEFLQSQGLLPRHARSEPENRDFSSSRSLKQRPPQVQQVEAALLNNSVAEDRRAALRLAKDLQHMRFFSFARQYLALARKKFPDEIWFGQQHAVCTYKDPDLPSDLRLDRALAILNEVDAVDRTTRNETLGIAGSIHKNKWAVDGQRTHLEDALACYERGYQLERDGAAENPANRYTGINAAYVLDLLADAERGSTGRLAEARKIREEIRQVSLAALEKAESAKTASSIRDWWFLATLAEACFGLGHDEEARYWIREALTQPHSEWMFESFARQLASIGRLRERDQTEPDSPVASTLRILLGENEIAIQGLRAGKTGLALSGGGFRASLFHIGVLARLAELDILRHIEALSCVSGGSIVGAYYYLEVQNLLESKSDEEIGREDYVQIVKNIEANFLRGVQRDLRNRLFSEWGTSWRAAFKPGYSHTARLGEMLEQELYARVGDGKGGAPRALPHLLINPKGAGPDFSPKVDNWRRAAKAPILILNATTLNTGHNWQFTATWMGEPPSGINTEIDANSRLRRMYYWQVPEQYREMRLGHAVAASAAVPLLFDPLELRDLYPGRMVRLSDGGVHDNQGMSGLLGEDCTVLLVSDASGQLTSRESPSGGHFGVVWRANEILQERVRGVEYREAAARRRSRLIRGLMFVHLTKDLDGADIAWNGNVPPSEPPDVRRESRDPLRTNYNVLRSVQRALAKLRTDLDAFTDTEAAALMLCGYRMTALEFPRCIQDFRIAESDPLEKWTFHELSETMTNSGRNEAPDLVDSLEVGRKVFGKTLGLLPWTRKVLIGTL
ncbi:MAG: patatin-like phospholipase family protein, partial [Acidobacteriota bacterium]|nr:patatin-like phospholipase family protein [Acidobacteriota bacterium]